MVQTFQLHACDCIVCGRLAAAQSVGQYFLPILLLKSRHFLLLHLSACSVFVRDNMTVGIETQSRLKDCVNGRVACIVNQMFTI